jgi:hypothetical protein
VEAYVVPLPDGAATFFDPDLARLDPAAAPLRLDVYSPYALSDGELAYLQTEFEAAMVEYAERTAAHDRPWRRAAAIGLLDLVVLVGLLLFALTNADRAFLIFAWAFVLALAPGPLIAVGIILRRRRQARAGRLRRAGFAGAVSGQGGSGAAFVKGVWDGLERAGGDRDLLTLERICRVNNWPAGVRFYRSRRSGRGRPGHRGRLRWLTGGGRPRYVPAVVSRAR